MANLTNREILFIVRMRNEARQMLRDLGSDWRAVAREAGRYAAAQKVSTAEIDKVKLAAREATAEINRLNAAMAKGKSWHGGPGAGGGGGGPGGKFGPGGGPGHTPGNGYRPGGGHGPGGAPGDFYDGLKNATKHMLGFVGALAAMEAGVRGIEKYFEHVTEYTNLQGKIGLVTSQANAPGVSDKLFQVAMSTHQDIESVGEAYYKGKGALGRFGYSDNQIVALSKVINEANLVSHASPQAAKYGTYELMQGIGAGTLNGRELRFVAQDSIRLATALGDGLSQVAPELAKKFGHVVKEGTKKGLYEITPGDLKELATKKLLTGDLVAKALLSQEGKLDGEAQKIPLTVPRVKNDINTSLTKTLGEFDSKNGISEAVVKSLEYVATTVIPMLKAGLQPVADAIHAVADGFKLVGGIAAYLFGLLTGALPFIVPLLKELGAGALAGAVAFGIMALAAAGLDAALGLVADGIAAVTAAIALNPILMWAAAIAGAVALFEVFKDKQVSFGGQSASIGAIVGSVWEHTLKFVAALWSDLMGVVQKVSAFFVSTWQAVAPMVGGAFSWIVGKAQDLWNWISQATGSLIPNLVRALLSLPESIGNIIAAYVTTFGKFIKGVLGLAADGVGVFNKGLADQIRAAGGTVEGIASSVAGGIKSGLALGAKYNPIVMMGGAAVEAAKYLGKKAGDAYKGTWSDAVAKTKAGAQKHQTYALGDLDKGEQELDPNGAEAGKGKKGRKPAKGPDLEKQAEEALKSLTSAYAPFLAAQVKDGQDKEKLAKLDELRTKHLKLFNEVLKNSGLTLEGYRELQVLVQAGMDTAKVGEYFKTYSLGIDETAVKEAKHAQLVDTGNRLWALRQKALREGGDALKAYNKELEHFGQTNGTVEQSHLLQGLHIDAGDLSADKVQAFLKTYLSAKQAADADLKQAAAEAKTNGTGTAIERLLGTTGPDAQAALERIKEQGHLSVETLKLALSNKDAGLNAAAVAEQTKTITDLVSKYDPYLQMRRDEAQTLHDINEEQQKLTAKDPALIKALEEKGIKAEQLAVALGHARIALTDQNDFTGQAQAAAARYIQNVKVNGETWGKVWDDVYAKAGDALANFIKTGKVDFAGFVDSILADLARLEAEQFLSKTLSTFFPQVGSLFAASHHVGGLVGATATGGSSIPMSAFVGARRFHSGGLVGNLRDGEVPIIAKQNEAVLPTTRLPDGNFGVRALMPDSGNGGGGGDTHIHFSPVLNITPPESASNPKDYGETLAASLTPALRRMVQEELVNQSRSGGILNQRR